MDRTVPIACLLAAVMGLAGCERLTSAEERDPAAHAHGSHGQQAEPIATGEFISGTLWNKPVASPGEAGSNQGGSPPKGSRVEVYENFIVVTDSEGVSEVSLHGWYTNLRFKRD